MNYLDRQMQGLIDNIKTQIKREEAILKFIASLDLNVRPSSINNEFLFSIGELEFILKVCVEKKEYFEDFLITYCDGQTIGNTLYFKLFNVVRNLSTMTNMICLTHHWHEGKGNGDQ